MALAEIKIQEHVCSKSDLLNTYRHFLDRLPLASSSRIHRYRAAKRLLKKLNDIALINLTSEDLLSEADPLINCFFSFLMLHGYLRPAYTYLFSRKLHSLVRESAMSPLADDVAALRTTAIEMGFAEQNVKKIIPIVLRIMVHTGNRLQDLTVGDLEECRAAIAAWEIEAGKKTHLLTVPLYTIQNVLYHMGVVDQLATKHCTPNPWWARQMADIPQPGLRSSMVRYIELMAANRRKETLRGYCWSFVTFTHYLIEHSPDVQKVSDLMRQEHIEPWLTWNAARCRLLPDGSSKPLSLTARKRSVLCVKNFLDTINEWGWTEAPQQRLLFNSDIPKLERPLPRYIPHDQEVRLMAAIRQLPDPFQRYSLEILRETGLRIGELLDLELDCVHEVSGKGAWLKVPLGKMHTERMIPLSPETVVLFDNIVEFRGKFRAIPHPETGQLADFLFVRHGHRIGPEYIRSGLAQAVHAAGLVEDQSVPLAVTPHRLRHTFATTLVNAGISLQALMRLLGHVSVDMSLRYGRLFDSTVRQQYEDALSRIRQQYAPTMLNVKTHLKGEPFDDQWIEGNQRKTRLAHGYCQIDLSQQACPHANICERCPAFIPLPEAEQSIRRQLEDINLLIRDALARGWDEEAKRHRELAKRMEDLLGEIPPPPSTSTRKGGSQRRQR